jgi:uncharacterized protein
MGIIVGLQLIPGFVGGYFAARAVHEVFPQMEPQGLPETPEFAWAILPWMAVAQAVSILTAQLVAWFVVGPSWTRRIGLRSPTPLHLLLALLSLPGIMILAIGIDGLAARFLPQFFDIERFMRKTADWPWISAVFIIGVGPGIGEELWFRGFIGRGLIGRHGVVAGVLLTSLLFGLVHLEPRQIVSAFSIGLLLHLVYLASQSLWIAIFLHTANNSVSVLAVRPNSEIMNVPAEQIPPAVYLAAAAFTVLNGWAFYRTRVRTFDDANPPSGPKLGP